MQIDMHFYGVYALARAAGLNPEEAHTVAYASQFVDDATRTDTEDHEDGGKMRAIATAHSGGQVAKNRVEEFPYLEASSKIIGTKVYGYHQAALYHRDYVLKNLLPRHRIAVY